VATAMAKASTKVRVFLLGDGVTAALSALKPANADYNPQGMLSFLAQRGTQIGVCRTCMEMRGIPDEALVKRSHSQHHGRTHCLDGGVREGAGLLADRG
jgi:sulfur relay (sulfurtransferase) complex TusBCD TusD component (DsrE family)